MGLHIALQFPERMKKIVLCCTSPGGAFASFPFHELPGDQNAIERAMRLMEYNDLRHTKSWQENNSNRVEAMIQVMESRLIQDHANPEYKRGYSEQIRARAKRRGCRSRKIKSEAFICAGLYDGIAPKENQKILEKISHSRCEFYNGGHLFLIEDSKA